MLLPETAAATVQVLAAFSPVRVLEPVPLSRLMPANPFVIPVADELLKPLLAELASATLTALV